MKGFKEFEAEKINLKDGRTGYFFASSTSSAPSKIKILVKSKPAAKGVRVGSQDSSKKATKASGSLKHAASIALKTTKNKKKATAPSKDFKILSTRLKEAYKLKASKKYQDRDFDKLIDAL